MKKLSNEAKAIQNKWRLRKQKLQVLWVYRVNMSLILTQIFLSVAWNLLFY